MTLMSQDNQRHQPEVNPLVDSLFRHESGKLVASLTRFFGLPYLELVEDAVQEALLKAAQQWPYRGIPAQPTAWLWQVAKNQALDRLRREKTLTTKLAPLIHELDQHSRMSEPQLAHEIRDNLLRLIFTCCHPLLPPESQVALTLKTICGFSIPEIARAFLIPEATVAKRLVRAKQKIRQAGLPYEVPQGNELSSRLTSVQEVLYLLFNEGYSASQGDRVIRGELCGEAIRLAAALAEHPTGDTPKTHALLALMLLHTARLNARQDERGHLLPLAEQDRLQWDKAMILKGLHHLKQATTTQELSEYHLQAGIAACHCVAPDYAATDWPGILHLYDLLLKLNPSPVIALNRAVALAEVYGAKAGLEAIRQIQDSAAINSYHFFYATRAELHLKLGDYESAGQDYEQALTLTGVPSEKDFLAGKLAACQTKLAGK
jgi:RNA polymerase sigma-70 factor (ECF subfamily)